jgi:hypothetical protein
VTLPLRSKVDWALIALLWFDDKAR